MLLPTKYSMQENQNNTQELENSSFSNIANNQNLKYNTINEAIKADPRKETYALYGQYNKNIDNARRFKYGFTRKPYISI